MCNSAGRTRTLHSTGRERRNRRVKRATADNSSESVLVCTTTMITSLKREPSYIWWDLPLPLGVLEALDEVEVAEDVPSGGAELHQQAPPCVTPAPGAPAPPNVRPPLASGGDNTAAGAELCG
eukprot:9493454-Pyramimonas_sp.AAC.1